MRLDPDGTATAIVAPGGQRTSLSVTGSRLSRVVNPAGETVTMDYDSAGLLSNFHDARQGLHHFTYDAKGLVTSDTAPDGSSLVFSRNGLGQNYTVSRTTAAAAPTALTTPPTLYPVRHPRCRA